MTTKSHSTPFARLSRIGLALGIGSTQATRDNGSKGEDESYIPYNGTYESPTNVQRIHGYWDNGVQDAAPDARSFSHLSFNGEQAHNFYNQTSSISNGRKYSNASRVTLSNIMTEPRRRFSRIRQNSTPPPRTSYVTLDRSGGIGDTPVPIHRTAPSQSGSSMKVSAQRFLVWPYAYTPLQRRDSVFRASLTDFRKGFSRGDDKHEKTRLLGASTDDLAPNDVTSPYVYEQASGRSRSNSIVVRRRHPYATASPYLGPTSPARVNPQAQKSEHVKSPRKKVPAHLKPSSRASLLKASISTPDLRAAARQPAMYLKTKAHWLSAETWCDAFMFPRPRFLLRHLEEDPARSKPRLVSPAESIISEPVEASTEPKSLKKSQSVAELRTSNFSKVVPTRVDRKNVPRPPSVSRPRSFALDDLALPSPIPSLITCVPTSKEAKRLH
jgi:serine/arginine repetitive matrix protein 2